MKLVGLIWNDESLVLGTEAAVCELWEQGLCFRVSTGAMEPLSRTGVSQGLPEPKK